MYFDSSLFWIWVFKALFWWVEFKYDELMHVCFPKIKFWWYSCRINCKFVPCSCLYFVYLMLQKLNCAGPCFLLEMQFYKCMGMCLYYVDSSYFIRISKNFGTCLVAGSAVGDMYLYHMMMSSWSSLSYDDASMWFYFCPCWQSYPTAKVG